MMSDFWVALLIVTPIVLVAVVLGVLGVSRADKRQANTLASRIRCPVCDTASLVWTKVVWGVDELHDRHEESWSGFTFRCNQCTKEFNFTRDGRPFQFPDAARDSKS